MPEPLDFHEKRDAESDSWVRADPRGRALVAREAWDEWVVRLPDGSPHLVHLRRENGAYVGECDCRGFEEHDGPCAHLCTLRKAEFLGVEDARGDPVRVFDPDEERAQGLQRTAADGGERR